MPSPSPTLTVDPLASTQGSRGSRGASGAVIAKNEVKLLVVSQDMTLAGALAALAARNSSFVVVGHEGQWTEVNELVENWQPSVVVIALDLPGSVEAIGRLDPGAAVLALDVLEDPERMLDAFERGANGYATSSSGLQRLLEAIETVSMGSAYVPPTLLGHVLRRVVQRRREERSALEILESLTAREREVFELAAKGLGHSEVADRLYISPGTARTHLQRVFGKLDVHSRAELVALAAQCGLDVGHDDQVPG